MRIAQCVKPLNLNLLGNRASVHITEGWQGDLDQVLGVNDAGKSETVIDFLGPHYTPENFRLTATGDRRTVTDSTIVTKPQRQE